MGCQLSLRSPPSPGFRDVLWRATCHCSGLSVDLCTCIFSGQLLFLRGPGSQPHFPQHSVTAGILLSRWPESAVLR